MSTLAHAEREHTSLREMLDHLHHRHAANDRAVQQLAAGRNGDNGGGGYRAASRGVDTGLSHLQPTGNLQQAYGQHQAAPSQAGMNRRPKKLTLAQLQEKRDELHAVAQSVPAVDHWAEPEDKPSCATLEQAEKALKECFERTKEVQRNPDNPAQALNLLFSRLDPNHSARLDRNEFIGVGRALGFDADPKIMNSLFNRYDFDRSNTIDMGEFGKMLFRADGQSKAMSTIGRVRECLALRAGGFETLKAMALQFRIGDRDRSGQLTKEEFDVMLDILLNAFKMKLSPAEKNNLFTWFDVDKSGGVSYDEFVREVRGPMNKGRENMVQQAFQILDKDGSGVIDMRDLANTYDPSQNPAVRSGRTTPQDCLNRFLDSLGGHKGKITWEEFLDHYQWISSNIDNDDYFELMMRNAWHISGGSGWAENTSDLRVVVLHSNGSEEVVELQHDMGLPQDPGARYQEIVKRLQKQGVKDIKKIEMATGMEV